MQVVSLVLDGISDCEGCTEDAAISAKNCERFELKLCEEARWEPPVVLDLLNRDGALEGYASDS